MRFANASQRAALLGSFDHHYEADVYYDGERRLQSVPITSPSFKEDGDAAIQQSGSLTVVWSDEFARSISPRQIGDVLAPFGPEIHLFSVISAGKQVTGRIQLGKFPITSVPSALDEEMQFRSDWITLGSVVDLEFKELTARIDRDRFDAPTAPTDLTSMWNEIGRITGEQLTRSVPDVAIPLSVMYQENRLDAVADLLDIADAVPHVTSDGTLGARPNEWPEPVDTLERGIGGSIVSVGNSLDPADVYNRVAFRGKSGSQTPIQASLEVLTGPLRTRNPDGGKSPYGRVTKFLESDYVLTDAEAQEYCARELPRVAQLGAVVVPVVEILNPLRERGDVVRFKRLRRQRDYDLGRIVSIDRDGSATQTDHIQVLGGVS